MEAPSEGRGRHGRQHSSSFGSQRGMPGSISRLARAISVKGRKPGENQMASSPSFNTLIEEALERPAPNLDPEKLINTFEDKLGLIQKMLKDYQNEGKKPDGEKQQKKIAAQAASVAGEAKGKNKKFTEEEAYKNDKIERRVKSAGAGASRALSERVQLYRTSPVARAELEERCAHHLKAKAEAEAHAAAERARTRDFIRTNRTCLQGEAGLRSLGEFAHTLPLPSRPATAGTRPSTAPLTTRDGLSTRADVQHMQPPQATSLAQEQQSAHGLHGLPRIRARPQTAFPHSHTEGARTPTSYWGDTPKTFLTHGDDSSREASPLSGGGGDDSDTEHPRPARTPQPARTAVSFERTHAPPASPIPPDPRTIPAHPPAAVHGGLLVPPRACQLHAPASGDTTLPQPTAYIPAEQVRVSPTANPPHAQGPSMSMSALAGHSRLPASPWLSHSGPLPSAASMVDPGSPRQQLQPAMSSVPSLSRHHAQSTRFAHSSSLAFQSCASRQTHQDQQDDMPDSPGVLADDQGLGAHMHGSMEGQGQSPNFSRVLAKVRALNALSQASRPPSRMTSTPKSTGDRSVFGPAGQCWEGSGQPEEPDLPEAAEMAEVERELRLLLTSRPGGGGSPTTRKRFNKQYKLLAQKREKQIEEARLRKEDLEAARRQRSQLEAKLRAEAEENERRQREQAQRKAELIQRHRTWLGTCNLASKLWFVADCVMKDREVHPIRELRRRAAITIAEWYRDVLQRRRWRQLLQLQLKLRQLLAPYLAAKQAQVRQRCGLRILHFCELHHRGAAESAVIAVKRFRRKLVVIQRAWRICLAVRAMQRMLLYNHLSKFEKTILTKAQREAEVEESAGRQRVKRPLTIRKTHTTPLHRGDSVAKRESLTGARKPKQAEFEDPVVEEALRRHVQPLSKEVKQQVVAEALIDCRRKFHHQMMAYLSSRAVYMAQKPIEDLRQALLRDSGLQVPSELVEPQHPIMLVLLPRSQLKVILFHGIQLEKANKARFEAERRARAEADWIQLQEAKARDAKARGHATRR